MTSFAVIGANGQLGTDLVKAIAAAGHTALPLTHADVEVADRGSVDNALDVARPDIVVNTAAFNVEASERDPAKAYELNAAGAGNVAEAAAARGVRAFHISTDYVFDGEKRAPYVEADSTAPMNAYGESKLAGELLVLAASDEHVVVRTSGLYGVAGCRAKNGFNFVTTMLKLGDERDQLAVVDDETMTPTYTDDLATQLVALAESPLTGVVHATSGGSCTWFEFASEIFALAGVEVEVGATTSEQFNAGAELKIDRPDYSVLENAKLAAQGIDLMSDWRDALRRYLAAIDRLAA